MQQRRQFRNMELGRRLKPCWPPTGLAERSRFYHPEPPSRGRLSAENDDEVRDLRRHRLGLREPSRSPVGWPPRLHMRRRWRACPDCNSRAEGETPRMPHGFKVEVDKGGWGR